MKKYIYCLIFALSACSTVFNDNRRSISFDSNIAGVDIYVDDMKVCKTPCSYNTKYHFSDILITAEKNGYSSIKAYIRNGTIFSSINSEPSNIYQYNRNGIYIELEENKNHFSYDGLIRRYSLMNFSELKLEAAKGENGEYIAGLSGLTGKTPDELIEVINVANSEVSLAHALTGIQ